jgi:mRNA-degrading endonuclease toxin of MazEF toxin-antitoxin module
MQKDFDEWNIKKKNIHNNNPYPLYRQREIWWCFLGTNVGLEHDGDKKENLRPILVLKGLGPNTCFAVPLTSSKQVHPMRIPIGNIDGKNASAVISQLKVIDTKRLVEKICYLDKEIFELTRKAIKDLL